MYQGENWQRSVVVVVVVVNWLWVDSLAWPLCFAR
jgi:hypothetical protein